MYILQTSQVVHVVNVDNLKTQKMSTLIGARELISLNLDQDNGGRYRGLLITFHENCKTTISCNEILHFLWPIHECLLNI